MHPPGVSLGIAYGLGIPITAVIILASIYGSVLAITFLIWSCCVCCCKKSFKSGEVLTIINVESYKEIKKGLKGGEVLAINEYEFEGTHYEEITCKEFDVKAAPASTRVSPLPPEILPGPSSSRRFAEFREFRTSTFTQHFNRCIRLPSIIRSPVERKSKSQVMAKLTKEPVVVLTMGGAWAQADKTSTDDTDSKHYMPMTGNKQRKFSV